MKNENQMNSQIRSIHRQKKSQEIIARANYA